MKITKEIGIDAGHRVSQHGSKCFNIHGHRYRVIAEVEGELGSGEENGMVMDFGFLKEIMMEVIDAKYDHGFIIWKEDEVVKKMFDLSDNELMSDGKKPFKLIEIDKTPTAENLAELWFNEMKDEVIKRTEGRGKLTKVTVWETPTSSADYVG